MRVEIDVGNSQIKWRVQNYNNRQSKGSFPKRQLREINNFFSFAGVQELAISSVGLDAEVEFIIQCAMQENSQTFVFIAKTTRKACGVICGYKDPSSMGVDRWLAIIAAYNRSRKKCCVIDIGTAITVDWVNSDGRHLGGQISPGAEFMSQCLYSNTSQIRIDNTEEISKKFQWGRSTAECVSAGTNLMVRAYVEYIIYKHIESVDCEFHITGGGANSVFKEIDLDVNYSPELVLDGLHLISQHYFLGENG
jgi:type III pantothenate kinase